LAITYAIFVIKEKERVIRSTIKRAKAIGECQFKEVSSDKLVFRDEKTGREVIAMIKNNQIWTIGADQIIARCLIKYKLSFELTFQSFPSAKNAADEFHKIK
jgi:hypothetical protein